MVRTPPDQRNQAEIDAAVKNIQPLWLILDKHLENRPFVAGDHLTIGDIPLGCAYWRYINIDIERPALPNCQLWYQNLKDRQAYRDNVMLDVV
jgi:glutathione S-transferase